MKLLTDNYREIIIEAFKLPEKDFYSYYSNVVNKHSKENPDIIERLLQSLNEFIRWHKELNNFYLAYETDEAGNKTRLNGNQFFTPLREFGINRSVNLEFFNYQIEIINQLRDEKPQKPKRKELTYISLFRDPDKAKEVESLFESREYTIKGKWQGVSGNKTELLAAFYTLQDKGIFIPGKITPQAKAFYEHFGLDIPGYISERALRGEPFNDDRQQFEILFEHLR